MKKIRLFIFYIIVSLLIVSLFIVIKNTKQNLDNKSDQIDFLKKNLDNKVKQIQNIHTRLLKKNINIENLIFEDGIVFEKKDSKVFKLKEEKYNLIDFVSKDLIFAKHPEASSSAYIDYFKGNIYLVTATGQITFSNIENLDSTKPFFSSIKSNIQELIRYSEFYNNSQFGVKDILVRNDKIYVSYVEEHYKDCYGTSILEGNLNIAFINFIKFYRSEKCVEKNNDFFSHPRDKLVAHQSGGRMIIVDNNLYLSTGEYRYRTLAQNDDNDFGKIISINLSNKDKKIVSKGHRNPQGLFYSKDLNMLFSTEHGPAGGDEINFLKVDKSREAIPNYGWPMSSYGRHYFDNDDDKDSRYELSPLYKSHAKYGYIEPLKYFVPSVGISQIIGVSNEISNKNYKFFVGTMGNAKKFKEGMISLFYFEFDKIKEKIIYNEFIPIKSRVRDMIYVKEKDIILMFLENYNSIAIFKKN